MNAQLIADALGDQLQAAGIRYLPYLGDQVNPPCVLISLEITTFHGTFAAMGSSGLAEHAFTVHLLLQRANDRAALEAMAGYMSSDGTTSLRTILEGQDPTLGAKVAGTQVIKAGPPVTLNVNGTSYIDVPFDVHVFAE